MITLLSSVFAKKAKTKKRLVIFSLFLLLLFTNKPLVNFIFSTWEYEPIQISELQEGYDVGILLGGFSDNLRSWPNGNELFYFQGQSANRLTQSVELYNMGIIKRLLITHGSLGNTDNSEAHIIVDYLVKSGIPRQDLIIENKGLNTYENALYTKKVLDKIPNKGKSLLLTSAFHMSRSKKCFDRVGLDVTPFSIDYYTPLGTNRFMDYLNPDATAIQLWSVLIKEWVGIIVYKTVGYI